jgi:hypothetical protein
MAPQRVLALEPIPYTVRDRRWRLKALLRRRACAAYNAACRVMMGCSLTQLANVIVVSI